MAHWKYPLCPGPVSVPASILAVFSQDYGSADLEEEFFQLYESTVELLRPLIGATNENIHILSGEGMVGLWGCLNSVIRHGERVLAVGNGIYGVGIGEMAKQRGAQVRTVQFDFGETIDCSEVERAIQEFRPKLLTFVHCDTPSGVLNPLHEIGALCQREGVLFYVDFVSSGAVVPVDVTPNHIDLGILGSQKALSAPAGITVVVLSEKATLEIAQVDYSGYDALKPFATALRDRYMPYTHNWHNIAALHRSLQLINEEGIEQFRKRHNDTAALCRKLLQELGLRLVPHPNRYSPTVTAAYLPDGVDWKQFDTEMRKRGVLLGGSYGPLSGRVLRVGHMGSQARIDLVQGACNEIGDVLRKLAN